MPVTLRRTLAHVLIVAGRLVLIATVLLAVWIGFRGSSVTENEVIGLFVVLTATGSLWPMLLLPMASAALTTTSGGVLAAETVLGRRTVAEPRVVHALRIPGQVWGWQVEVVGGRGRAVIVSSELWDWPDGYELDDVPWIGHPWWWGWLAIGCWMLGGLAVIAIGFGLIVWLIPGA